MVIASPARTQTESIASTDERLSELIAGVSDLSLSPPQPAIRSNFPSIPPEKIADRQIKVKSVQDLARVAAQNSAGRCQKIAAAYGEQLLSLEQERLRLELEYPKLMEQVRGGARLAELENPAAIYNYLTMLWLGETADPDGLMAFGEAELSKARVRYLALQKQIGFEGDHDGLAAHLSKSDFRSDDFEKLEEIYRVIQKQTRAKMSTQFFDYENATMAGIAKSDRGQSFPAFGYYIPSDGTFYYNPLRETYDLTQMRWLFIHEASPGHHFFFRVGQGERDCQALSELPSFYAYLEGWAAYVETLGEPLGAYQRPEDEMSAVAWDMVRSVRVVLDVGLNLKGWSEEDAIDYWHKNVPGQDDIAKREITRVQNWPVQAITYKFGAEKILEQKRKMQTAMGEDFDPRKFHDLVLKFGDIPFSELSKNIDLAINKSVSRTKENLHE